MDIVRIVFVQQQTKDKILKIKNDMNTRNEPKYNALFEEMCSCYDTLVKLTEHCKNDK